MSETVTANNGEQIPLISAEQVFTYDGNFIDTITVIYAGTTYVQTFINNGTKITEISGWIAQ